MRSELIVLLTGLVLLVAMLSCGTSKHDSLQDDVFDYSNTTDLGVNSLDIKSITDSCQLNVIYSERDENIRIDFDGINGRRVTYRNIEGVSKRMMEEKGTASYKICIDNKGQVSYAEVISMETTLTKKRIIKDYLKLCLGYRFEENVTAPCLECGKLIFKLDINTFN
jgi:hypothetical protein